MSEELQVKELSAVNLEHFLEFFDNRAFCDNPEWAPCYCCFYYFPDDEVWEARKAVENREHAIGYINNGKMNGFLALKGHKVVGWCNADKKSNYRRIIENPEIDENEEGKSAAVVCFATDPDYRGQGIAAGLLAAACRYFKEEGFEYMEAYPRKSQQGDAHNYHGPVAMYKTAGFNLYSEASDFLILRKSLR